MKHAKILSLLLVLTVLCSVSAVSVSAEAWSLSDGSFESWGASGKPGAWEAYAQDPSQTVTSAEAAHSGSYGLNITTAADKVGIYQNIGSVPIGTSLKISAYVKIVSCSGSGVRLIARYGNVDGTPLCYSNFVPSTNSEWQLFTMSGQSTSADDLYIEIMTERDVTDCSFYVDDFTVTEKNLEVVNSSFDSVDETGNGYSEWSNMLNAEQTSCVAKEGTNNVVSLTAQGFIRQAIQVAADNKYRISFDVKTDGPVGLAKIEWDGGMQSKTSASYNTGNVWVREVLEAYISTTNISLLLRYVGTGGYHVYYDNVTIERLANDGEIIENGSFEYGVNGATGFGITNGTGSMTAVKDAHSGVNGMELTSAQGANVALGNSTFQFTVTEKTLYELSVFAKVKTAYAGASVMPYVSSKATGDVRTAVNLTAMPMNKWTKISMVVAVPESVKAVIWLRIIGGGSVIFDDFSVKPLKEHVSLSEADGTYTESFTAKSMLISAYLLPDVTEGSETESSFAAVYKKNGNIIKLVSMSNRVKSVIDAGSYKKVNMLVTAPDDFSAGDGKYFIKVFSWKSLLTLTPKNAILTIR